MAMKSFVNIHSSASPTISEPTAAAMTVESLVTGAHLVWLVSEWLTLPGAGQPPCIRPFIFNEVSGPQINTLRPRQNKHHFAIDIFKYICLNKNIWISIKIPMKFFPNGPINNMLPLVQILACRRQGGKLLSKTMMVKLPTYVCVLNKLTH